MNLQELKNKARSDFENWLQEEFEIDEIVGTEPDDWDEAIRDFAGRSATYHDPNVILEDPKLNEVHIDFVWYDTIGGMIYDNVYKFLDRYLYDEFDDIVNEITESLKCNEKRIVMNKSEFLEEIINRCTIRPDNFEIGVFTAVLDHASAITDESEQYLFLERMFISKFTPHELRQVQL